MGEFYSGGSKSTNVRARIRTEIGVPEVWVVDRDTRVPRVFRLTGSDYEELPATADRWLRSPTTGVWLRPGSAGTLEVQLGDDAASRQCLPQE